MDATPASQKALLLTALPRAVAGIALVGCLLFIPAGTLDFWQAWLYIGVLFIPLLILAAVLLVNDPALLERRMRLGEREASQKAVVAFSSALLLAILLVPGLDRRYQWSSVPTVLVLLSDAMILLGWLLYVLTVRENRFASRVVEVQDHQVVISMGPYSLVRHPMYLAMSLMFGLAPLALGSYSGLIPGLLFPVALAFRIDNEEQLLRRDLSEYAQYCQKVRFRMLPLIW